MTVSKPKKTKNQPTKQKTKNTILSNLNAPLFKYAFQGFNPSLSRSVYKMSLGESYHTSACSSSSSRWALKWSANRSTDIMRKIEEYYKIVVHELVGPYRLSLLAVSLHALWHHIDVRVQYTYRYLHIHNIFHLPPLKKWWSANLPHSPPYI